MSGFRDVMVDLETRGTRPGSIILSIGAVAFSPGQGLDLGIGSAFSAVINTASCVAAGLTEDAETVAWWDRQSPDARKVLDEAAVGDQTLAVVMTRFADWLRDRYGPDVRLWGNGSDFDNALIAEAFCRIGLKPPWDFWNNRCYRTLKGLAPSIKLNRTGTHHNALDDARSQAEHACRLLAALKPVAQ